jgi:tRNA pseudouridine55 synthase
VAVTYNILENILIDNNAVIGVGSGTKYLNNFLAGDKEYYTVGLLGSATVSYDSQDPVMYEKPFSHVTRTKLQSTIAQSFLGKVDQTPPLFSAVRIDGMRLFDYARKNKPLEKPIPPRPVEISECEVTEWFEAGKHPWRKPSKEATEEDKKIIKRALDMVEEVEKRKLANGAPAQDQGEGSAAQTAPSTSRSNQAEEGKEATEAGAPAFGLRMTVSSGTYVRCVVHDLANQVGSAAHVVRLTRLRQGPYSIPLKMGFQEEEEENKGGEGGKDAAVEPGSRVDQCIEWDVFVKALEEMKREAAAAGPAAPPKHREAPRTGNDDDDDDDDAMNNAAPASTVPEKPLKEWERILLAHSTPVASS